MSSIIPRSEEKAKKLYNGVNELIQADYDIERIKARQKDILEMLYDNAREVDIKKAEFDKSVKGLKDEFLKGKITEQKQTSEEILDDYAIAQKHLKG